MAVLDKFANTLTAAGKKAPALNAGGAGMFVVAGSYEIAAADDDASVIRLARLAANAVPILGQIWCDALTSGTDWDLGLYKPGVGGAVVDKDLLADGVDLSSAIAITTFSNNALTNLGGADPRGSYSKQLWELLGLTKPARQDYDLALTANTIGSAAGTVSWFLIFAQG